jgi:hypothetical protein
MDKEIAKLLALRDKLRTELRSVTASYQGRIEGIEIAISLLSNDEDDNKFHPQDKTPRGESKALVIDLLTQVGTLGLNAEIAVQMASQRGLTLKRGTAASELSRFKADGIVVHDGERYRLPNFAKDNLNDA